MSLVAATGSAPGDARSAGVTASPRRFELGIEAQTVLGLGALIAAVGLAATSPILIAWGATLLAAVALVLAWARHVSLPRFAGGLRVSVARASRDGSIPVGGRVPLRVALRWCVHGTAPRVVRVRVELSAGLRHVREPAPLGVDEAGDDADEGSETVVLGGEVEGLRVGPGFVKRVVLEVALVGARVHLEAPVDLAVLVLPRSARHRPRWALLAPRGLSPDAVTASLPRRGMGSDLRELRDHVPGDAFKQIAWKATARRADGKLIVREVEGESTYGVVFVMDVGEAMREGAPGQRALDAAVALVAGFAEAALARRQGHRVGLVTYGDVVFGTTQAASGPDTRRRILEHLVEVEAIVHDPHVAIEDGELALWVQEHLDQREGSRSAELSDGQAGPIAASVDDPFLVEVTAERARHALSTQATAIKRWRQVLGAPATDTARAWLLTYCRFHGIELPRALGAPFARRWTGLVLAAQRAVRDAGQGRDRARLRAPMTLVVVTRMDSVGEASEIEAAVRVAAGERHRIVFADATPETSRTKAPPRVDNEREAVEAGLDAERRLRAESAVRAIRRAGGDTVPLRSLTQRGA